MFQLRQVACPLQLAIVSCHRSVFDGNTGSFSTAQSPKAPETTFVSSRSQSHLDRFPRIF